MSLTFPQVGMGSTSPAQGVTLSNTGNASLSISSIAITGTNASDFAETNTCGASVAAGGNCSINVTFTPSLVGGETASVSISDNASGSPQAVNLTGTGTGSANASLSTTSLNFGNQPFLVTSAPQTATLTNSGNATLNITSIVVTGGNAGDFSQNNNCGSTLAAGSYCAISVTFFPTSTQTEGAAVSITDNASGGSPQTVNLTGTGVNSTGQFMALDPTKTYLVNTITDTPVFIAGDQPQTIMEQVSQSDVDTYLADRAARGFNTLLMYLIDGTDQTNAPDNYYGYAPFDGADFTNEDANYWSNVDLVLQKAARYNITVVVRTAPVHASVYQDCSTAVYCGNLISSTDAVVQAYGAWLGNRYQNYPNIVWMLGADGDLVDTPGLSQKMNDLATGILSGDPNHLITYQGGDSGSVWYSSLDMMAADGGIQPWLGLNFNYAGSAMAYRGWTAPQTGCSSMYTTYNGFPQFEGEDAFEGGEHLPTELELREEAYWEVLSGCTLGRIFGNNAIWSMGGPGDSMGQTWQSQLSSGGSLAEEYQGQLFRSREFWKMVPDTNNTVLTGGYGSGTTISVAACTSDGQTIIAYVPNGNATTITINMSAITSATNTANAWWFNPSNGSTTLIGSFANSGTQNFTPPDPNDWVLVIDDAGANLPPPEIAHVRTTRLDTVRLFSRASRTRFSALSAPRRWPDWTMVTGLAFVLAMITARLRSRKRRSSHRGSLLRSEAVKKWHIRSASALHERGEQE